MLKANYDQESNTVVIEFEGKIDAIQADQAYRRIQKIVPRHREGFRLLADFTLLDAMHIEIQDRIKETMDFLNKQGVTEILRVVPSPEKDFGFDHMSLFHYSREVKIRTLKSREEAQKLLRKDTRPSKD